MATNVIVEYIKTKNKKVEKNQISPNTVPNYIKPIKLLLDQNNVPLIWKRLYKMFPREIKSKDRAYTKDEIRKYFGADKKTQYIQHRINIPDGLIQKMGWDDKESLTIYVESRNGKKRIVLKNKD